MLATLKYTNFRKLYIAGVISELGSFISDTAVMLYVFNLSDQDNSLMGITRAVFLFFLTLGNILGGPLGEKYNRNHLLIISNLVRIPAIIMMLTFQNVPITILGHGLIAFFTGIYNPSRQALVNEVVPSKDIKGANSLFSSTFAVLHLIGPFLGASLYTYFNGITEVFGFDLLTYIVGIALLLNMHYKPPKKVDELKIKIIDNLSEGLAYCKKRRDLTALYICCSLQGFCIGVLLPMLLPYLKEVLGQGDEAYGVMMSAFGFGGIIGGALYNYLSKFLSTGKIIISVVIVEAIMFYLWILSDIYYLDLAIFFIWGIFVFLKITGQINYMSETVETKMLTRCYSLNDMTFFIPNIGAGIIVGIWGNSFSAYNLLLWTSYLFLGGVVILLFMPHMKDLYYMRTEKIHREVSEDNL